MKGRFIMSEAKQDRVSSMRQRLKVRMDMNQMFSNTAVLEQRLYNDRSDGNVRGPHLSGNTFSDRHITLLLPDVT